MISKAAIQGLQGLSPGGVIAAWVCLKLLESTQRGALRALRVTPDGSALRVEATLSRDEVSELLNVQRLVQLFQ